MQIQHLAATQPIAPELLNRLRDTAHAIFGSSAFADGAWRAEHMPSFTVFAAQQGEHILAFKLGYARTRERYYSWLGGVVSAHRGQGYARHLMQLQHEWLQRHGYRSVETLTQSANAAMIDLNLAAGFRVVGMREKHGLPYLVLEKILHPQP